MPINSKHPEYDDTKSSLTLKAFNGDVLCFIPRLKGQNKKDYKDYRERAAFFNVVKRTCKALVGAITRKPETSNLNLDTINISGNLGFKEFIVYVLEQIKIGGRVGLLVDFNENINQPEIIGYDNGQIINWREENGKLSLVVLHEPYYRPLMTDPYETEVVDRFRELTIIDNVYTVSVWEKTTKSKWTKTAEVIPTIKGSPLTFIPFIFINSTDTTPSVKEPILFNLSELNIAHFKNNTDLEHAAHFTALPQPYITGSLQGDATELSIGTYDVWQLDEGSSAEYLEFSGAGMKSIQEMIKHKESQMSAIGSRLLQEKKGVESVESLRIRQGSESATLISLVGAVESGITKILEYYNLWSGITTSVEFKMNRDFSSMRLTPQEINTLMDGVINGTISQETFLQNLYDGEIVDDVEDEKQRLNKSNNNEV